MKYMQWVGEWAREERADAEFAAVRDERFGRATGSYARYARLPGHRRRQLGTHWLRVCVLCVVRATSSYSVQYELYVFYPASLGESGVSSLDYSVGA